MSKTVTITGMEVTAKSDGIFLEVAGSQDNNYTTFSTTGTIAVDEDLFPVHHETWSGVADITDFDLATAGTYDNWYYRYSDLSDDADHNMTAKTYISRFDDYVADTYYAVRLHSGSQDTGYDLRVKSITIPANKGITVVVAGADGYQEFNATSDSDISATSTVLANTVTTTAQNVNVYIYFNGDDDNVYTDNITALTGQVQIELTADTVDNA